jgi:tRNA-specific 2-thiouridylase
MKKVIVGLSGGVDSAVAVILLQQQGYLVEGMFMRNWDSSINNDVLGNPNDPNDICPQEKDYMDAVEVANKLNIKLHRIDFVEEYWERVFQYFLDEYRHNRTPNPDILCNKEIKFKAFLEKALELGCDYIAMGHYARVTHEPEVNLLRGLDNNKDQSYFLSQLSKAQLSKSLFPIGHLTKPEVRKIAKDYNLNVATKKDSTGVCFIGERNFKQFLSNYLPAQKGEMRDLKGNVVGYHDGIMYYTIGQRHGLGIGGPGDAWFVVGKIASENVLLVDQGSNQDYLFSNRCFVSKINWLGEKFTGWRECTAKFRYRQPDVNVKIRYLEEDKMEVVYPDQSKAVTPGQACVFYDGEIVLGGSTIDEVYMDDSKRLY